MLCQGTKGGVRGWRRGTGGRARQGVSWEHRGGTAYLSLVYGRGWGEGASYVFCWGKKVGEAVGKVGEKMGSRQDSPLPGITQIFVEGLLMSAW